MKDLNYHYTYKAGSDIIFQFPTGYKLKFKDVFQNCNFGDKIAVLNMHLYFSKLHKFENYRLSIKDVNNSEDLHLASIFFKDRLSVYEPTYLTTITSPEIQTDDIFTEIYKNQYTVLDIFRDVDKNLITYSFDCNSYVDTKIPNYIDRLIPELVSRYNMLKFVEVGKKLGVQCSLDQILRSRLSINLDNGIAHLCRCTQTHQLLIEHMRACVRGHPVEYYDNCRVCKNMDDIIDAIGSIYNI